MCNPEFNFSGFNPPEIQSNTEESTLFNPYWSIIPLKLSSYTSNIPEVESSDTFDPFQIDKFVDDQYINKQYSHPLIMKHSQVLLVSKELPILLLKEQNQIKST